MPHADGVNEPGVKRTWLCTAFWKLVEEISCIGGLDKHYLFQSFQLQIFLERLDSFGTERWSYSAVPKLPGLDSSSMEY